MIRFRLGKEEGVVKWKDPELVVTQSNCISHKTIKDKKKIFLKVGEFDMKDDDFLEIGEKQGEVKSILSSLEGWAEDKRVLSKLTPRWQKDTIKQMLRNSKEYHQIGKLKVEKNFQEPEIGQNIIDSILNQEGEDKIKSIEEVKNEETKNIPQIQETSRIPLLKKRMSYLRIDIPTNAQEESQPEKQILSSQKSPHNNQVKNQVKSAPNTPNNKKIYLPIKLSAEAQRFQLNKKVINQIVLNKIKGNCCQNEVLKLKQLDLDTRNAINSFKVVNQAMRKSDFIINYDWLKKELNSTRKSEKIEELDIQIQQIERNQLNYQSLSCLFVEKYKIYSSEQKFKKEQINNNFFKIIDIQTKIKELKYQLIQIQKKNEEIDLMQFSSSQLTNSKFFSKKGLTLIQKTIIEKKQQKILEMRESELIGTQKNISYLSEQLSLLIQEQEEKAKYLENIKADKSNLKHKFKNFINNLIQSGQNLYQGSVYELVKLLMKMKIQVVCQDLPSNLDELSQNYIISKAKLHFLLDEIQQQKLSIRNASQKEKILNNINLNSLIQGLKNKKQEIISIMQQFKKQQLLIQEKNSNNKESEFFIFNELQNSNERQSDEYQQQQQQQKDQKQSQQENKNYDTAFEIMNDLNLKKTLNIKEIDYLKLLPQILDKELDLEQSLKCIDLHEKQRLFSNFHFKLSFGNEDIQTQFKKFKQIFFTLFGFHQGEIIFKEFATQVQLKSTSITLEDSPQSIRIKKANATIIQSYQKQNQSDSIKEISFDKKSFSSGINFSKKNSFNSSFDFNIFGRSQEKSLTSRAEIKRKFNFSYDPTCDSIPDLQNKERAISFFH